MFWLQAEQRLAARRAARAEAREIRMRELERQQREQEDHADKAYDMYAGKTGKNNFYDLLVVRTHPPSSGRLLAELMMILLALLTKK